MLQVAFRPRPCNSIIPPIEAAKTAIHYTEESDTMFNQLQQVNAKVVEIKPTRAGKSRVKPRHLSTLLRRSIIDQFLARQSSEDVAEEFCLPVRCVDDVIKLEVFKMLRGPFAASAMARIA